MISAPRPLVHGGGDTDVPPEHRHRGVAAIPGATFEVLDGGTHLAVHAHPDAERAQGRAPDLLRAAPRGG